MTAETVNLGNCARCGLDHRDLAFEPLTRPIEVPGFQRLTHWAPCPANGEPILMWIQEGDGA